MHICPYGAMTIFILNKIRLLEPRTQNRVRSAYHILSRVKSGGGAASLPTVAGRIACTDARLFEAFSCPRPPPSPCYTLREIEQPWIPLPFSSNVSRLNGMPRCRRRLRQAHRSVALERTLEPQFVANFPQGRHDLLTHEPDAV